MRVAALLANRIAVSVLGGDSRVSLRLRAVICDQVRGLATTRLTLAAAADSGAQVLDVACRAVDGVLPAALRLRAIETGETVRLYQEARLRAPGASLHLVAPLVEPLAEGAALEILDAFVDVENVAALRRDLSTSEGETGVNLPRSTYRIEAHALPYRLDTNWLVVDAGSSRSIREVQPVRAGGALIAWSLTVEGAG